MTLLDLGRAIREKREDVGLSIDDVAARIKVGARILRAIEEGSTEGLPHAVYTKGFVRSFARIVGFDQEELNACLEKVFPPEIDDAKPEPGPMMRAAPARGAGGTIALALLALVVLAGLGGGGWYVTVNYGAEIMERVKQPFSAITASTSSAPSVTSATSVSGADNATAPAKKDASSSAAPSPRDREAAPASAASSTGQTTDQPAAFPAASPASSTSSSALAAPQTTALAASPALVSPGSSSATPASSSLSANATEQPTQHSVLIKAVRNCWIDGVVDGVRGRDFTLQAGKEHVFTYTKSLNVRLGNPGGVEIFHDGVAYETSNQSQPKSLQFP